jgi:hypothetical protein
MQLTALGAAVDRQGVRRLRNIFMIDVKQRMFVIAAETLLLGLAMSTDGASRVSHGIPPMCTPSPPVDPFIIFYSGTESGCSNRPGGFPICFVGEAIQFSVGDHQILCPETDYDWQFPDSATPVGWKVPHVFSNGGVFVVNVSIANSNGSGHLSQTVTVAAPSAIPTASSLGILVLLLSLGIIGARTAH